MNFLCEECEERNADIQCSNCGQQLCLPCDKKIHNKGKRLLHVRNPLSKTNNSSNENDMHSTDHFIGSDMIIQDTNERLSKKYAKNLAIQNQHQKNQETSDVQFSQENNDQSSQNQNKSNSAHSGTATDSLFLDIPINQPKISIKNKNLSFPIHVFQKIELFLRSQANKGHLIISLNEFNDIAINQLQIQPDQVQNLLQECENIRLLHQIIRKFGENEGTCSVSLKLNFLSMESILWVLKSLRNDQMSPTDRLILSRIKESFAIKISYQEWMNIINNLITLKDDQNLVSFQVSNEESPVQQIKLMINQIQAQQLSPNQTQEQVIISLEDGEDWQMLDSAPFDKKDKELWNLFIYYLKDFFDGSKYSDQTMESFKWISSVESSLNINSTNSNNNSNNSLSSSLIAQKKKLKKSNIKPPKSIQRAIPGGKYGCAQLIKCCGQGELKKQTLGKICQIIQEAIRRNIIIYYKTLLIKPNSVQNFNFEDYLNIFDQEQSENCQQKIKLKQSQLLKIEKIRKVVIQLLSENDPFINLAKLPKLIQKRLDFSYDLHELGFTKLKNLLQTFSEVLIENEGTTFAQVRLKQPQQTHQEEFDQYLKKPNQRDMSPTTYNKKFSTMMPDQTNKHYASYYSKNLSNLEDYMLRAQYVIRQLITENPYGISAQKLYQSVNQKLGIQFDYTIFGCSTFEEFLSRYVEQYADIMIKMQTYFIYPKNFQSNQYMYPYQMYDQQAYYQQMQNQQQQQQPVSIQQQKNKIQTNNKQNAPGERKQLMKQSDMTKSETHHQKSQSTLNALYNNHNNSSLQTKTDSFFQGFPNSQFEHTANQSLTFHSFNTNTQTNKDFYMGQEGESNIELDSNLKFIEELLQDNFDKNYDKDKTKVAKKGSVKNEKQSNTATPQIVHGLYDLGFEQFIDKQFKNTIEPDFNKEKARKQSLSD